MAKKIFIGIKQIWYADPIKQALTATSLKSLLSSAHEVLNSHSDTWGYEESDPEKTEYLNELTGQNYYVDVIKGSIPTVSFTMGEYDYVEKADLQGGMAITANGSKASDASTAVGWRKTNDLSVIEKAIIARTKSNKFIVLTRAAVTAKGNFVEKNLGLGVTAMALENGEVGSEYWFDGEAVNGSSED